MNDYYHSVYHRIMGFIQKSLSRYHSFETTQDTATCSICLSKIHRIEPNPSADGDGRASLSLQCGHEFHRYCIAQALLRNIDDMRCPNCRSAVDLRATLAHCDDELYFYKAQLDLNDSDPVAHHNYALALKDSSTDHNHDKEIFDHLAKAAEQDPAQSQLWLDLANNWHPSNRAIRLTLHGESTLLSRFDCYNKAVELNPEDAIAKAWVNYFSHTT